MGNKEKIRRIFLEFYECMNCPNQNYDRCAVCSEFENIKKIINKLGEEFTKDEIIKGILLACKRLNNPKLLSVISHKFNFDLASYINQKDDKDFGQFPENPDVHSGENISFWADFL